VKKLALVLFGLFLAAMAVTVFVHGDPVTMLVGVALAIWSGVVFRKVWRMRAPAPDPGKPRPWEN
jgi:hypothetical protein